MATTPAAQQIVFLVHGVRKIREVCADILVCEKLTWARVGRKRFLLGTTAFYSRKAAEVRKLGELRKLAVVFLPQHMGGIAAAMARVQLAEFNQTGVIH